MTNFTSQSSNFISAFSGAVDPRTGMYNYNFVVAQLTGNAGLGPSMPVALSYSPLTPTNTGFGTGVILPVSRYDKSTRTLELSTGERYKVSETSNALNIIHTKPVNFRTEIREDGYYILYKNGATERLTAPTKGGNIKVTEKIFSPANRTLVLEWENFGNGKRLTSVSDESGSLLSVKYFTAGVTFIVWPDSTEEHIVTLKIQNDFLISVTNKNETSELLWSLEYTNKLLTAVTGPTGLKELVSYSATGHKFPTGGPTQTLPYVISHKQTGNGGHLIQHLSYIFSDKNFLGYGGSNQYSWDADTDYLYGILGDYEYSSIETAHDKDGNALHKVTRTYSNYHLQTKELRTVVGTTCKVEINTDYHAMAGKTFDDQPPQFQFPKQQTQTLTDNSKTEREHNREEVTLTEFDAQGNPVRQQSPDGTVTEYAYYPAGGDGNSCPPEPNGFVRFLKKKTITPRETADYDSLPEDIEYTYCLLGDTNCVVQNASRYSVGNVLISEQKTEYNSDSKSSEFGRVTLLTETRHNGDASYTTSQTFTSTVSDGLLKQDVVFTGHDGLTSTHNRTVSAFSGQLFSETDAQNTTTNHKYDLLGRIVRQTIAPGTEYENNVRWDYTLGDDGPVTTQTDTSGNKMRILFDSAGRETGRQHFDPDVTQQFYDTSSQSYDLLGRPSTVLNSDWLTDTKISTSFSLQATVTNDSWGGTLAQNLSDNTQYFQVSDPLAMQRTNYVQGSNGKTGLKTGTVTTSFDPESYLPIKDTLTNIAGTLQGTRLYTWDGRGQLRSETDEQGNVTTRTYDELGRVLTQTLPDGTVVTRTYAPHLTGKQVASISVTGPDAREKIQTWLLGTQKFDGLGRLVEQVSGGRTTTFTYEGASPVPSTVTHPSGKKLQYTYIPELGNQVSSVTTDDITQTFRYDKSTGRLLQEVEGGTGNKYAWNDSGSLKTETFMRNSLQSDTAYTSTLAGATATYQDVTGKQMVYSRDEFGRITELNDNELRTLFEYDELGRMCKQTVTSPGGTDSFITELKYDDFGREVSQKVTDSAGALLATTSTWTKNGLLESKQLTGTGSAGDIQRNEKFEYDARNRLVRYSVSGTAAVPDAYGNALSDIIYHYDALNNLTAVVSTLADGSSDTMAYVYGNDNDPTQLTSVTHSHEGYPPNILLEYDANGRMIKDEAGRTLTYDSLGRLSSVTGENLSGGSYLYDASNRLTGQGAGDNKVRQLYYRGSELVVEVAS